MSENYIVINGKKADLTPEQLKALGIEMKKPSPFDRSDYDGEYYFISTTGDVMRFIEVETRTDKRCHEAANYCTDKDLLQQQAYRETLNRLLWRFSMEHDGDKIDWNNTQTHKWYVSYNHNKKSLCGRWIMSTNQTHQTIGTVYFFNFDIAEQAIEEIVKPFMENHPDFKI